MADMVIFARSAKVLLANTDFAKDFYQVLCNKESNNFIFSPISVHSILSLTYQGAAGSTAESFANTLRLENATVARDGYKSIIESLNNVEDITLYTANKIYVKTNYRLNATFNEIARYSFYSEIEQIDFEDNENAANTINVWVEKTTKEKIKNLISANDLNSRTRMILINAIYFKGNWRHKFNPLKTKKQPFYVNQNQVMYVDMMHTKERFRYSRIRNLDANILLLPYKNSDFSMLIILPNERNGIGYLESKLASVDIAGMVSNMQYSEVNVALPKFRIESTLMLNNILEEVRKTKNDCYYYYFNGAFKIYKFFMISAWLGYYIYKRS